MKTILHISADFPDPIVPAKTKAVERLVAAADGFRHIVYSLNRGNWRTKISMLPFEEDRIAVAYGAPPYGFRLLSYLDPVAGVIADDLRRRGIRPDLIHAHKFSVDGIVADRLSSSTGAPFIASIWGDTDRKFFEGKPGLRAHYREIARRVRLLLPPAPWTADYFSRALRLNTERFELLPVMTGGDALLPPQICDEPRLVTLFNWDCWRRKGFDRLLAAFALLAPARPEIRLDVYGRGGAKAVLEMTQLIERSGASGQVRLLQPLDNDKVQHTLNGYAGFVLPSRRETYGMVFIEAVLAGLPILWPQHEAVDGFFDPADVGYRCNAHSYEDIAAGMCHLITHQSRLKQRLATLQAEGAFESFRRAAIGARYREILGRATSPKAQAADAA